MAGSLASLFAFIMERLMGTKTGNESGTYLQTNRKTPIKVTRGVTAAWRPKKVSAKIPSNTATSMERARGDDIITI